MSSGYVYQGKALPVLQGKYIFGDITTGNIWYTDFKDMVAAHGGDPKTMARLCTRQKSCGLGQTASRNCTGRWRH
jgi:hypothetical protein